MRTKSTDSVCVASGPIPVGSVPNVKRMLTQVVNPDRDYYIPTEVYKEGCGVTRLQGCEDKFLSRLTESQIGKMGG